jgi:2'-5' RNA ligase
MPRLFVAVDPPAETRERLGAFVRDDVPGLRRVPKEQLHLTLHFIGEGEVERFAEALAEVRANRFELTLDKLGSFGHGRRPRVLWMGVAPSEGLTQLYGKIGEVLRAVGFEPGTRLFMPHMTLARAKAGLSREEMNRFLLQKVEPPLAVRISEFHLYSSKVSGGGHEHFRERTYALDEDAGDARSGT